MSTVVYVAGPMSGKEDYNYAAFHAAEEQLRDEGYEVNNPARNFDGDTSLPYTTYIEQAIRDVLASDWIFCLPGWRQSVGARTEVHVAATLGKPVYERVGVGGKRIVKVDKFGTPSASPAEFLAVIDRAMDDMKPFQLFSSKKDLYFAPPPVTRQVTDYQGAVDGGGYKGSMDDPRKLPIWLVPRALIDGAARALQHGAIRYAPNNWRKGMNYSEVYSALQRHLLAWNEDEDIDPDSGLNHLDHAAACLGFLSEYVARPEYARFDNRLKRQKAGIVRAIKEGVSP